MKTIGDKPKLINDMTSKYTFVCNEISLISI